MFLRTWLAKPGQVEHAVKAALREGYKHIDCAHAYGNETEIGVALQKSFKEGVLKREDVFITSKLRYTRRASALHVYREHIIIYTHTIMMLSRHYSYNKC